MIDFQH